MNIANTETSQLTGGARYPYLLGENTAGKPNNWGAMQVGLTLSIMLAELVQIPTGYMGAPFVTANVLYLPSEISTVEQILTMGQPANMGLTSVLTNAISDGKMVAGGVYKITYKGKVNDKGVAVNYDNFEILEYSDEAVLANAKACWESVSGTMLGNHKFALGKVTVNGATGTELFVDGISKLNPSGGHSQPTQTAGMAPQAQGMAPAPQGMAPQAQMGNVAGTPQQQPIQPVVQQGVPNAGTVQTATQVAGTVPAGTGVAQVGQVTQGVPPQTTPVAGTAPAPQAMAQAQPQAQAPAQTVANPAVQQQPVGVAQGVPPATQPQAQGQQPVQGTPPTLNLNIGS